MMTPPACLICQVPLPATCDTAPLCSAACVTELEHRVFGYIARTQAFATAEFMALLQIPLLRDWAREIVWCTSPHSDPPQQQFIVVED